MRMAWAWALAAAGQLLHGGLAKGPCDSEIYCTGDLLHAVQMAGLFADDKTFVDKPTLKPPSDILNAFAQIGGRSASAESLRAFVSENFGEEGSELKPVDMGNLTQPAFLDGVRDPVLQSYGRVVHGFWASLVRKQDLGGLCRGCVSSMLPLRYHFVVPGGRFRETYYWDTYFALVGVLRSGLYDLARDNIRDLLSLVDSYGFVPNGARIYYLNRSQPPLLTLMVKLYYEFTKDRAFVAEALPLLYQEHQYWMDHHAVNVPTADGSRRLSRYFVDTDEPRPESYSDDYKLAHNVSATDPEVQARVYADMATGAESGWDFSTRWAKDKTASQQVLETIRTRQVVPVDLNAILYQVEQTLTELSRMAGIHMPVDYEKMAGERRWTMEQTMLDTASGLFYDFVLGDNQKSTQFTAASLWPYWAFGDIDGQLASRAFGSISKILDTNPGGLPSTLINSGQQWDWPMAWPPLQYVAMQASLSAHHPVSLKLAQAYVNSVFCAWYRTGGEIPHVLLKLPGTDDDGHMFEKFDSSSIGNAGGGGEYEVQAGFGWTNGVLLWVLDKFGGELSMPQCPGIQIRKAQSEPQSVPPYTP